MTCKEARCEREHVVLRDSIGLPEQESLEERLARAEHDAGRPIGGRGWRSHCWLCRRDHDGGGE